MLTTRDLEIIRYLEQNFLITSSIASRLVYWTGNEKSSLIIAQKRLKVLFKEKEVKRLRDNITNEYVYYLHKAPTKINHRLKIADFISRLNRLGFELQNIELEYSELQESYNIRPDIMLEAKFNNVSFVALVEVDLTKSFSNITAYTEIVKDRKNKIKQPLPNKPLLLISVSDTPIKRTDEQVKPVQIKTDFSDIVKLTYPFITKINK